MWIKKIQCRKLSCDPIDQRLQQRFQPFVTSRQVILDNTTDDIQLLKKIAVTFTNFLPSYSTLPSRTTPWFLKNKLYPEPHSLHQAIMSYHPGIPPYWSIKIPYSPSVPFSGRTLLGKSLSNLHHHVLITCLGHYQWHPFSYCTPCLQINPTFHCRRW